MKKDIKDYTKQDMDAPDFNNFILENDYPCLTGNGKTWRALSDGQGGTIFTDGISVYRGPVNIIGGNLIITKGAVVDGSNIIGWSNYPVITIQDGGVLKNSQAFDGYLEVQQGGRSENNQYFSEETTGQGMNGVSDHDSFYEPGNINRSLKLSKFPDATWVTLGNGAANIQVGSSGVMTNANIPDITKTLPNASNKVNITVNGQFGDSTAIPNLDSFFVKNDYECLIGNSKIWRALPDGQGGTIFTDGINVHRGPVNIIGGNLVITKGAVVDGSNIIGWGNYPVITIQDGGVLKNSQAFNGYLEVQQGGRSENNKYFSEESTGQGMNGVSDHDLFYEPGSINRTLKLSKFPDATWVTLGNGAANIQVGSSGQLQFPTIDAVNGNSVRVIYNQGGSIQDACFLAGSMIRTIEGDIAVEDIKIGDQVFVYKKDGQPVYRSITWVGSKQCKVDLSKPYNDMANYPVRIVKNALGDNVPYKDMLVTSEHCLFINGQFIPVRMLVNNYSIYYDQSILSYTYYHIELENHSVIMADGVLTESYLDTDSHVLSHINFDDSIQIEKVKKSWENAAAPLIVDREVVEPIFNQYYERSKKLGLKLQCEKPVLTDDMNLHLITDQGEVIYPTLDCKDKNHVFVLPAAVESVRILSRVSRLCDAIGPFVDDRRNLGVLVGQISLFNKKLSMTIDQHLKDLSLLGWNNLEASSCRWTEGDAYISLRDFSTECKKILIIQVLAAGPYIVEDKEYSYNIAA